MSDTPEQTSDPMQQLQQALTRFVEAVLVRPDEDSAMFDLPIRQITCLRLVADHEGQKLRELAARLALPLPSVSRLVDRLVRAGLVARHTDPDDRRAVRLETTPQSRDLLARHRAAREAHLTACANQLSPMDMAKVIAGLDLLTNTALEVMTTYHDADSSH